MEGNVNAIEFSGKIQHGAILLPKQFEAYDNRIVRVIVLLENSSFNLVEKKEKLRLLLEKMKSAKVFDQIKDPVSWQKKLRDEWE